MEGRTAYEKKISLYEKFTSIEPLCEPSSIKSKDQL